MLCNLKECYLIIYAALDNSIILVEVNFDAEFCEEFFNCLSKLFFDKILSRLKQNINTQA